MVKIDSIGPQACKHVLSVPKNVFAGYRTLHLQEAKHTRIALEAMPDAVASWYRHLTLYDRIMRREYEWPREEPDEEYMSWKARVCLAIVAESTAKLVLDASLAGYYSQAYGMLRHMVETWEQMVYLRLNSAPGTGMRWFTPDGVKPADVPKQDTIRKWIRKHAKNNGLPHLVENLDALQDMVDRLNGGAHPGSFTMVQAHTETPGFLQLGAKFDKTLLTDCMALGTAAMALLLCELEYLYPDYEVWMDEFREIQAERNAWLETERGEGLEMADDG